MPFRALGVVLLGAVVTSGLLAACGREGSRVGSTSTKRRGTLPTTACDPLMTAGTCRDATRQAMCDYAADSGTFTGSLAAKRGAVAVFRVDAVRSRRSPTARPVPVA